MEFNRICENFQLWSQEFRSLSSHDPRIREAYLNCQPHIGEIWNGLGTEPDQGMPLQGSEPDQLMRDILPPEHLQHGNILSQSRRTDAILAMRGPQNPYNPENPQNPSQNNQNKPKSRKRGKYRKYTREQKQQVVRELREGTMSLGQLSRSRNIPAKNIRRWNQEGLDRKKGAGKKVRDPEMERKLRAWVVTNNIGFNDKKQIRDMAIKSANDPTFSASKGWMQKFFERLRRKPPHPDEFKDDPDSSKP